MKTGVIKYDGGEYNGEILKDLPQGKGTYIDDDGTKYVGEWDKGDRNGKGIQTKC